jgi:hypothetical protein
MSSQQQTKKTGSTYITTPSLACCLHCGALYLPACLILRPLLFLPNPLRARFFPSPGV